MAGTTRASLCPLYSKAQRCTQPAISYHIIYIFNSVSKITVVPQPTFSWISKEHLGDAKPHHLSTTPAESSEGAKADLSQALATVQRSFVSVALKQLLQLPRDTRSQLWSCSLFLPLQKQVLDCPREKKNNLRWHQKISDVNQWKGKSTSSREVGMSVGSREMSHK